MLGRKKNRKRGGKRRLLYITTNNQVRIDKLTDGLRESL